MSQLQLSNARIEQFDGRSVLRLEIDGSPFIITLDSPPSSIPGSDDRLQRLYDAFVAALAEGKVPVPYGAFPIPD